MPLRRFRIVSSTLALIPQGDRHVARMVPSGSLITVLNAAAAGAEELTEVEWEGQTVMMFAQDLRTRSEPIEESCSGGPATQA